MRTRDLFAVLAVPALWGFNFPAIKVAVDVLPPLFMSGIRFGAVFLLLVWLAPIPRGKFGALAILSTAFGVVHFGLLPIGMTHVDAAAGAIVMQSNVLFAALLAAMFLRDPLGRRGFAGLVLGFAGVAVLAGEPKASSAPAYLLLVGVSAFGWGAGQILVKKMGPMNPFAMNAWLSGMLAPQLFVMSYFLEDGQWAAAASAGLIGWGGVAYQVMGASVLAYGLWYYLLGRHDVSRVVPFNLLVPVFGVVGGVFLLGEALTMEKIVGGLLILSGVALAQVRARRSA